MYRFLLSVRWLGAIVLTIVAALVMVRLGIWQMHRYEERSAINARIDAADTTKAVPMTSVMARPTASGQAGASPGNGVAWTKVTVSGTYDVSHEIQARARTVNGDVGFEIVTPLTLGDGTAVLVDRGWVPAPDSGALAAPVVPPAPTGPVTVVGQIHLSESRPTPIEHRDGRLDTRRISVGKLAEQMPYPVYGAYVLLTQQTPTNSAAFTKIPIDKEDSWQNAGYTVQWWLFAGMTLFAFGWQARKEALIRAGIIPDPKKEAADRAHSQDAPALVGARAKSEAAPGTAIARPAADQLADPASADRVEEADRTRATAVDRVEEANRKRTATQKAPVDRVEEADRKRAARKAPVDRVEEADQKRAAARKAPVDRVEEADRKRAAEAERKLAAQSGQD